MNQGIHLLDLLLWYFGDPVEVQSHAGTLHRDIEVEDTLAATLRFAGGALATVTATTTAAPGFPYRVEVYGTKGGIQVEGESARRWETVGSEEAAMEPPETEIASSPGAGGDPRGISSAGHAGIYKNFIETIIYDRSPLVDGREGRRSLAAALGIYRAAGF
jgi:predicted dehydrogenase